jgi:hypothetical protein
VIGLCFLLAVLTVPLLRRPGASAAPAAAEAH